MSVSLKAQIFQKINDGHLSFGITSV